MKASELIEKLQTLKSLYGDLVVETDCGDFPAVVATVSPYSEKKEKLKVSYFKLHSRMKGPGE